MVIAAIRMNRISVTLKGLVQTPPEGGATKAGSANSTNGLTAPNRLKRLAASHFFLFPQLNTARPDVLSNMRH